MQTIERKYLTLRSKTKRLARKSICFSFIYSNAWFGN
ncbi:IS1 family transposase [Mastigocoleus testarum]